LLVAISSRIAGVVRAFLCSLMFMSRLSRMLEVGIPTLPSPLGQRKVGSA